MSETVSPKQQEKPSTRQILMKALSRKNSSLVSSIDANKTKLQQMKTENSPVRKNRGLFNVNSSALRGGETIYSDKNSFREYKKNTHYQVDEVLQVYLQSKKNMQGKTFKRWERKTLTD